MSRDLDKNRARTLQAALRQAAATKWKADTAQQPKYSSSNGGRSARRPATSWMKRSPRETLKPATVDAVLDALVELQRAVADTFGPAKTLGDRWSMRPVLPIPCDARECSADATRMMSYPPDDERLGTDSCFAYCDEHGLDFAPGMVMPLYVFFNDIAGRPVSTRTKRIIKMCEVVYEVPIIPASLQELLWSHEPSETGETRV